MRSVLLPLIAALPLLGGASLTASEIAAGGTGAPEPTSTTAGGAIAADAASQAWEPAHWEDRGNARVWVEGHYVARPAAPPPNVLWVAGHWTWTEDGWVWSPGHYVSTGPAPQPAADQPAPEVVVDEAPPPVQVDVVAPCPGPDYCWCDGYWDFRFNAWVWVPGLWCRRPFVGAAWFGPRWEHFDHDRDVGHDRDFGRDHGDRGGFAGRGGSIAHGGFRLSPGHWGRR
jgi:hypothetical protein